MADFSSMIVTDLKKECQSRGLPVSGAKAAIIARLEEYEAANGAAPAAAAPAPKAKSSAAKKTAANSKKRKADEITKADDEEEAEEPAVEKGRDVSKPPPAKKGKGSAAKVDQYFHGSGKVYEDASNIWDATLMQVSLERNNNKFYILQIIDCGGHYQVFTRWGRVNEPGQNLVVYSGSDIGAAKKAFEKKFSDKTKNKWGPGIRDKFVDHGAAKKAYTLMDMADAEESAEPLPDVKIVDKTTKKEGPKVRPCTLAPAVRDLLALCFNEDTITEQLVEFKIDTNKLPLGRVSKAQLEKGRDILEQIAKVLNGEEKGNVKDLTGKFYTFVPHAFGRSVPPPINTLEAVQTKFDLINTLTDVTIVQDMMAKEKEALAAAVAEIDHPLDRQYRDLDCDIEHLPVTHEEHIYVKKYFDATQRGDLKLKNIFRIDRKSEAARYAQHDSLGNRKLLWHGTNIAVVVAILKTGLRIMPHSGGRVGRGIYHASENSKSSSYVRPSQKTGIMFIDEVVLGKCHEITRDDHTLVKAPAGFDSVLAQGWTEPEASGDITVKIDGRDVVVPQAKVAKRAKWNSSSFSQSEYLVYRESQVRMRYMLEIVWSY